MLQFNSPFAALIISIFMFFLGEIGAADVNIRAGLPYSPTDAARFVHGDPENAAVHLMDPVAGGGISVDLHDAEAFHVKGDFKELSSPGDSKRFEIRTESENDSGDTIVNSVRATKTFFGAAEMGITVEQHDKALGRMKCSDVTLERGHAVVFEQEYDMEVFHDLPMVLLPDQSTFDFSVTIRNGGEHSCQSNTASALVHETRIHDFASVRAALPDGRDYIPIEADTLIITVELADASTGGDQYHRLSKVEVRGWDMEKITLHDGHIQAWGGLPVRADNHTLLAPSASTNSVFVHPLGLDADRASAVCIDVGDSPGASLVMRHDPMMATIQNVRYAVSHNSSRSNVRGLALDHDVETGTTEVKGVVTTMEQQIKAAAHELTHVVQQGRLRGAVQRTTDVTGEIFLEEGREMVFLGDGIPGGELFVGVNISEPGANKDFGPYVAGRNYWTLAFPASEIMLNDGSFVYADEMRLAPSLAGHGDAHAVEEIEFVVERVEKAKAIEGPVVFELRDLRMYNRGDYDVDLGLRPTRGGLVRAGADICFEIPDADATNIQWDKDGVILPGAVNGRLCIANVRGEDSGRYTATYEDGTKGVLSYSVEIFVSDALPAARLRGLGALMLFSVLAGILQLRRKHGRIVRALHRDL